MKCIHRIVLVRWRLSARGQRCLLGVPGPIALRALLAAILWGLSLGCSVNGSMEEITSKRTPAAAPTGATALGWSTFSPSFSTSITAQWTPGTLLTSQTLQYFTDSSCTTTHGAPNALSAVASSHTLVGSLSATYWYQITSTPTTGAPIVSSCVATGMLIDPDSCAGDRATNTPFANSGQPGATGLSAGANFTICSQAQLVAIGSSSTHWNKFFKLNANIDMTGAPTWVPIGNTTTAFTGDFNGNNRTISNFSFSNASADNVGLFGVVDTSNIRNLTMSNVSITARDHVGAVVASYLNTNTVMTLSNLYVTSGTITGNSHVGGVVGFLCGSLQNATNAATILPLASNSANLGGLVGRLAFCSTGNLIEDSINTGTVGSSTANASRMGGILGYDQSAGSTIRRVRNHANITGNNEIGGIIGYGGSAAGSVTDTVNLGNISGERYTLGGLAGAIYHVTVQRNLSTGNVTANITSGFGGGWIGGLAGYGQAVTFNNNIFRDGQVVVTGNGTNAVGGVGGFIGAGNGNTYNDNLAAPRNVSLTASSSVNGSGFFAGAETSPTYSTVNHYDRLLNYRKIAGIGNMANPAGLTEVRNVDLKASPAGAVFNGWDTGVWRFGAGQYPQLIAFDNSCAGARATNTPYANSGETFLGATVDGSSTRPFVICTVAQLQNLAATSADWGRNFQQAANLTLTAVTSATIGNDTTTFTGSYDGRGYTISTLTITTGTSNGRGLFGTIGSAGIVSNLTLSAPVLTPVSGERVGALAGNSAGTLRNITIAGGTVAAGNYTGGIVGFMSGGLLYNSSSSAATRTISPSNGLGGIVGYLSGSGAVTIESVYSTGNVGDGTNNFMGAAGVIGFLSWSSGTATLTNMHYNGTVNAGYGVGGVLGWDSHGNLQVSYSSAQGTITSASGGGFGGRPGGTISTSWSSANVTCTGNANRCGGFVGDNYATHVQNYSTGNVTATGDSQVGGFAGSAANHSFQDCYTMSTVTITGAATGGDVGGFAGWANWPNHQRSFAVVTFSIAGGWTGDSGGWLGERAGGSGTYTDSYWNTTTGSAASFAVGNPSASAVTGATTGQMQVTQGTGGMYTNYSTSVWSFGAGVYPTLIASPRAP